MTFYERVLDLCQQRGKSITAVALELGMSKSVPYNWKNGTTPQNSTLQKVANYFGLSTAELLNFDGAVTIQTVHDNHGIIGKVAAPASFEQRESHDSTNGNILTDMEIEMLRLFRQMSIIQQAQLLVSMNDSIENVKK